MPAVHLLQSPFAFEGPALVRARARLAPDALELRGWGLRGRYRRRVPLADVLHADAEAERLVMWLAGGEVLRLRIADAARWRDALDRQGARASASQPALP